VLCTVAIGILVSTLTRNQVVAILLAIIVTIMPSFLYSGFLYPISSMSLSAQLRTYLFPGRYFVEISRGTFLKGTGFAELGPQLAILAVYTAVVFGAAALRFRKKVA
jgi:ABC-2 type transport system permease protein